MKGIEGELAIGVEKAGEEGVETSAGIGFFVGERGIKEGVAGFLAFNHFFVGKAFKDGHNGGIG